MIGPIGIASAPLFPPPRAPEEAATVASTTTNPSPGVGPAAVTAPQTAEAVTAAAPSERPGQLSEEQRQQVQELQARDREVRAHEQAHQRVGGRYAGAISYDFVTGPDGRQYAVGGSVPIDASPIPGDPEATIDKLRTVVAAALAPAEPSAQDRAVAQQAQAALLEAQAELLAERSAERQAALDEAVADRAQTRDTPPGGFAGETIAAITQASGLVPPGGTVDFRA